MSNTHARDGLGLADERRATSDKPASAFPTGEAVRIQASPAPAASQPPLPRQSRCRKPHSRHMTRPPTCTSMHIQHPSTQVPEYGDARRLKLAHQPYVGAHQFWLFITLIKLGYIFRSASPSLSPVPRSIPGSPWPPPVTSRARTRRMLAALHSTLHSVTERGRLTQNTASGPAPARTPSCVLHMRLLHSPLPPRTEPHRSPSAHPAMPSSRDEAPAHRVRVPCRLPVRAPPSSNTTPSTFGVLKFLNPTVIEPGNARHAARFQRTISTLGSLLRTMS